MKGFGERLKRLRKEANITQSELAEKLNMHLQTVSRWERDSSEPDMSIFGLISDTLKVTLEQLLGITASEKSVSGQFDITNFGKKLRLKENVLTKVRKCWLPLFVFLPIRFPSGNAV